MVDPKKIMTRRTFFCFNAASWNLHDNHICLFFRKNEFAIRSLLWNNKYLHKVECRVAQENTQNALLLCNCKLC